MDRTINPDTTLGSGTFGDVDLRPECAVKRTDMFDGNHEMYDDNVVEAAFAASLRDNPLPHLIRVHSVEVDASGVIHTSMERGILNLDEYVRGLSEGHRLAITESCVTQVVQGLTSLHEMGVTHGDLKLTNIMVVGEDLEGSPILRLVDFGASKTMHTRAGPQVQPVDCGTYCYAAPESLRSPQVPTPGWDAWGLGCAIYRLIHGRDLADVPNDRSQDPEAYLEYHGRAMRCVRRFGRCPVGISGELFATMRGLLTYDPTRRTPPTAAAGHVYAFQTIDPLPLPANSSERRGAIISLYGTFGHQCALIPLAVNMLDRYCDIAGWPVSETVRQSCMWLANTVLTPGDCQMRGTTLDKKAVMHVARTLGFRLYADTILSLLFVSRGHKDVDHERVRQILCEETGAWRGVEAYEGSNVRARTVAH